MNTSPWENKMIAFLEGELSDTEQQKLLQAIEKDEALVKVWDEYKMLYADLDTMPDDVPSDAVAINFKEWLDTQLNEEVVFEEKKEAKVVSMAFWQKAASIAAIFICVFGFWKMYDQNQQMGTALANLQRMMEVQSPTERIKAIRVNYDGGVSAVDDAIINVLVDVLEEDRSSNVRLAAVETLSDFMDRSAVRSAMIKTLSIERDGAVKLAIIHSLGHNQDDEVKKILENIVNDDSQEKFVIDEAHMQLIRLDQVDM